MDKVTVTLDKLSSWEKSLKELDKLENELDKIKYAAEIQGDVETAGKGIHSLCALRAKALLNHHSLVDEMDIKLKQFPISLSTRNYCIIGSFK